MHQQVKCYFKVPEYVRGNGTHHRGAFRAKWDHPPLGGGSGGGGGGGGVQHQQQHPGEKYAWVLNASDLESGISHLGAHTRLRVALDRMVNGERGRAGGGSV
jgi:hypothetical protein